MRGKTGTLYGNPDAITLAEPVRPDMSAVITLDAVTKTYPLFASLRKRAAASLWGKAGGTPDLHIAVDNVTLAIEGGETVGILGVNGAGKSTLLQLITGVLTPTSGTVAVNGRVAALLELGAGFNPALTGRQNAEFQCRLNHIRSNRLADVIAGIETFADVGYFFDQPMRTYSSGMYLRVAFAAAISVDPDILIVDEALAVGDGRFQNKCYRRFEEFKAAGKTILFVTHSPDMVTRHCTRGIVISKGKVDLDGSPAAAASRYLEILFGHLSITTRTESPTTSAAEAAAVAQRPPDDACAIPVPDALREPHCSDMLPTRPGYNPAEYRTGTGGVSIVDAAVLIGGQPAPLWIEAGARLSIAMQVKSDIPVKSPVYTIQVKTLDDVLIWSFSTFWVRHLPQFEPPASLIPGANAIAVFDFDNDLASGEYFVDLAAGAYEGTEVEVFDWRMSVLHIYVRGREGYYGLADLKGGYRTNLLPSSGRAPAGNQLGRPCVNL